MVSKQLHIPLLLLLAVNCRTVETPPDRNGISNDAELYTHVTQTDPFTSYTLFPRADSVTSGTLNGSNAHQPLVRVSMNATAYGSLTADTLTSGNTFADGSIIFKQIIEGGQTTLYAIIVKDRGSSLAANGWLWAELRPDGSAFYSVTNRGGICTSCHLSERGSQNDLVRTFERQMR